MAREMANVPQYVATLLRELECTSSAEEILKNHYFFTTYDVTLAEVYRSLGFNASENCFPVGLTASIAQQRLKEEYHVDASMETVHDHGNEDCAGSGKTEYVQPGSADFPTAAATECSTPQRTGQSAGDSLAPSSSSSRLNAAQLNTEENWERACNGLKSLAMRIVEVMSVHNPASYKFLSDTMTGSVYDLSVSKQKRRIKRRIYDVINILEGAGLVVKGDRSVSFRAPSNLENKTQVLRQSVCRKRAQLKRMVQCLAAVMGIMQRNRQHFTARDERMDFPFLVVATSDCPENTVNSMQVQLETNMHRTRLGAKFKQPIAVLGEAEVILKLQMRPLCYDGLARLLPHPSLLRFLDSTQQM